MSNVAMHLVLLGAPGSGKGTQAALLAERMGIPAISTGDMVRGAIASGSELGQRVESIVAAGDLVDDETMAGVVRARLAEDDAQDGFLLDGYPRTLAQADTLASILTAANGIGVAVVMIHVPEDRLVERLMGRGRTDDREDVIRRRLEVYRQQTEPLVDHYRELEQLFEVDGDQSVVDVNKTILEALAVDAELQGVAR